MKALRMFALAALLLAVYPSTAAATPAADPSERMAAAINEIRAKHDLAPLRESPKLVRTASRYARTVIRSDNFTHGSSFHSTGFRRSGEIMAHSNGWSKRPRPAIRIWLGSASHRALILSPAFRYLGAGIARGRFGGPAAIWIVHFGAY